MVSKLRVESPKYSLRRTADLRGGGTPIPRMDLDSPCVPVGWWVALFGRLGQRGRCFNLERGRPGSKWICFTGWAGRWPLDRLNRDWTYNQVLQVDCHSCHFPCCLRVVNLLAFSLPPNRVIGRPLPIAGLEGGVLLDEPTGEILPGVLSALESCLATVFNGGGAKYIPSPEQAGRLTKPLNAR